MCWSLSLLPVYMSRIYKIGSCTNKPIFNQSYYHTNNNLSHILLSTVHFYSWLELIRSSSYHHGMQCPLPIFYYYINRWVRWLVVARWVSLMSSRRNTDKNSLN